MIHDLRKRQSNVRTECECRKSFCAEPFAITELQCYRPFVDIMSLIGSDAMIALQRQGYAAEMCRDFSAYRSHIGAKFHGEIAPPLFHFTNA